jgi:hypothetical protein
LSRASELGSVVAKFEVFSGSVGAEEGKKGGQVGACHQLITWPLGLKEVQLQVLDPRSAGKT